MIDPDLRDAYARAYLAALCGTCPRCRADRALLDRLDRFPAQRTTGGDDA